MIKHHLKQGSLTFLPLLAAGCSTPLTHTALDLTPFGFVLSAVGWLYWTVALFAVAIAAARPPTRQGKAIALAVVLIVFGYLPATAGWEAWQAHARLARADAMFLARCQTAGEKIHRTAENVEGLLLMKLRPEKINYDDQFRMDDPYGSDSHGETYLKTYFSGFYRSSPHIGYRYVEAIDPKDGKRYRYTGAIKEVVRTSSMLIGGDGSSFTTKEFVLDKTPAPGPAPRYGVTYDDISTREEREYWIAGSSLKVIDLATNEVMAERIGYMMDRGQGETSGGRSPWQIAARNACPAFPLAPGNQPVQTDQTRNFVVKVLKPILEK